MLDAGEGPSFPGRAALSGNGAGWLLGLRAGMQNLCLLGFPRGVALLQVLPRASGSAVRSYYSLQFKWESY